MFRADGDILPSTRRAGSVPPPVQMAGILPLVGYPDGPRVPIEQPSEEEQEEGQAGPLQTPIATALSTSASLRNEAGVLMTQHAEKYPHILSAQKLKSIPLWVWLTIAGVVVAGVVVFVVLKRKKGGSR